MSKVSATAVHYVTIELLVTYIVMGYDSNTTIYNRMQSATIVL